MSGKCVAPAPNWELYSGPLSGGRHTAVVLNRAEHALNVSVAMSDFGLEPSDSAAVRDILSGQELGRVRGALSLQVRSHAVRHLVLHDIHSDRPPLKTEDRAANGAKPRHIVFTLVDDLGWNDVSMHGSKQIPVSDLLVLPLCYQ